MSVESSTGEDWADAWAALRIRIVAGTACKLVLVMSAILSLVLDVRVFAYLVGTFGSLTFILHFWLLAFRCPRCGRRFAYRGFGRPDPAYLFPPRKCVHCGVRRGMGPGEWEKGAR